VLLRYLGQRSELAATGVGEQDVDPACFGPNDDVEAVEVGKGRLTILAWPVTLVGPAAIAGRT